MNTCDTCKWWAKDKYCSGNRGRCNHHLNDEYSKDDGAFGIVGGEPYNEGSFETGPKFGCIHHSPKNEV